MKLADIQPAIASVFANPVVTDLREHTYLATYSGMIAIGAATADSNAVRFNQLSTMVYGWMPRIIRIDPAHSPDAVEAMALAITATPASFAHVPIQHISDCLHSVVGASKLLHFINPDVFPIWDSKIEGFRARPRSDVTSAEQYLYYVREVHQIRAEPGFPTFYGTFQAAYSARLLASGIPIYLINEVRAIEAAAFELAT
jgi:hypothetical protein